MQFLLEHQERKILLTLAPWSQFGQTSLDAEVIIVSWQDVSAMHQEKMHNDLLLNFIWLTTLICGVFFVYFISQKLQKSTADLIEEQQKGLLWSQQKLNALFELSADSIVLNRLSDGAYLDANPAMTHLTGYSLEELKQLSFKDLTPSIYEVQDQEQLQQLHETGRYGPYRKQYRHKHGELVDIELRGVKFISPSGEKMMWSTITDLRESLKLDRLKQDFISTVSHELRTPLTSVNGSLDLLLGGAAGDLPATAQKLIGIAAKNNKRLITLVNDLLDMEKLAQGQLSFKPEFVSSMFLIQSAFDINLPFAELHNIKLQLGPLDDVRLYVDPDRVQQVLTNLISNAAKFSPEGSEVVIHSQLKHQRLRIAVTDQGRGLSAEQIAMLFQRFSQVESSSKTQQTRTGSGLGLAISREIMLQSKGQIGVESELGVGSTFWIEFPVAQKAATSEQTKKILIIEDDVDIASTLKDLLAASGYDADIAYQLNQAWLLLQQNDYHLITLDLKLKEESGSEFFLKLRDSEQYVQMPVLIISAFVQQGKLQLNAIANANANAVDWLEKPFDSNVVIMKIEHLLSRHQDKHQWSSLRILHVEDDDDIVAIMQMQLERKFSYHHAGSLADAIAKLKMSRYNLVLLDIGLPDGTGWQLIPDLQLSHGNVPVIVFSAQDVSVNQRNQATAVFGKTKVDPSALVEQISHMLGVQ